MPPRFEAPEVTLAPPARDSDLDLAARFGLAAAAARDPRTWQLVRDSEGLWLCAPGPRGLRLNLRLDRGPLAHRLRTARRTDPLPRAIGLPRRTAPPTVVDATAGTCRDALVLAHLGCRVTAIERVRALAALVADAVAAHGVARLLVVAADAAAWLDALPRADAPDVICLDPMFESTGTAQVGKEMQICRALAGDAADAVELLAAARRVAADRVVVKRHVRGPPLADDVSFVVPGRRVRFDVYLRSGAGA
jgi:16S rRNA (guanine1516-N2)-methyltransferase